MTRSPWPVVVALAGFLIGAAVYVLAVWWVFG